MVEIRVAEAAGEHDRASLSRDIFDERFLIERPLLQALRRDAAGAPVLLIAELDRSDEPFEAFLLDVPSDFQITITEHRHVPAADPPVVLVASTQALPVGDRGGISVKPR